LPEEETLPSAEARKPRFFYGYVIVAVTLLIMLLAGGAQYSFGVFLNPLATEFGWSSAVISGAFSLYMVIHGALYIVTGRLNDRFGPRVVVTGTTAVMGLGYLLMSQVSAVWHVYLVYAGMISLGMSGAYVPLTSTVARWFVSRRGLMTGIALAGVGAGTMIVPPVASWLIASYGWRNSYMVIGIVVWIVIISIAQLLRRDPAQTRQLPYGYSEVQAENINLEVKGFSTNEAIRTGKFWLCCLVFLGFGIFLQAIMVHIVPHAISLDIPATEASTIFIAIGGLSIIGRVVMGSVGDRVGNRAVLLICFTLTTAAIAFLQVAKEMWMFYLFASIFGFSYGGLITIQSPLIAHLFGLKAHGVIFGIIAFIVTIGGAIGPVLAGRVFDITGDYSSAFLICGILSLVSLVISPFLTPVRGGRER
jgi:MFS family permease